MDDGSGIASALANRLQAAGAQAQVVNTITEDADAVLLLDALKPLTSDEEALAVNRRAFGAAKTVAARFARQGGVFVTVQDTGGSFGLADSPGSLSVWTAGLTGLVKTAAREWPQAAVKAIDLDRTGLTAEDAAERIFQELIAGGPEYEVGLKADGERMTPVLDLDSPMAARTSGDANAQEPAVLLVSGGARGVTAAAVAAMAKTKQTRFILLGRTSLEEEPAVCKGIADDAGLKRVLLEQAKAEGVALGLPELGRRVQRIQMNREIAGNLQTLQELGSEVVYVPVDVQDEEALREALQPVRAQWGPITGIIHGAGVLADKSIADKTMDQFDYVFDTKVGGLRALLSVTEEDPLTLICLFSSVSARSGNAGQADYAMANEVLNKCAQAEALRRGPGCIVKSINWGPWDGGMVSPLLKKHFEQRGVNLIPLEEGTAAFVAEALDTIGPVEVVIGGCSADRPTLIEGATEKRWSAELFLPEPSHTPWLNDHRIGGNPVVPAVMVMDWFVRAASAAHPHLVVKRCSNLSVKKGIVVASTNGRPKRLTLTCNDRTDGLAQASLSFKLRGEDGCIHYTAEVDMGIESDNDQVDTIQLPDVSGEPWNWELAEVYDGDNLFHGPAFQVIHELKLLGDQDAEAIFKHAEATTWSHHDGGIDPAMIDGGLQLARLWGIRILGEQTLPTTIGSYKGYGWIPQHQPVVCRVRIERRGSYKTVSHIAWMNDQGSVFAELRDVEMHIVASQK
ncbi:NAD(P)-dependent dehydrogenase (short-subunit alcohol dehydrogenase family) [Paenibacillus cellulosilyticus]|uniref:NAD(P)-dependent dehydrogenase (Short-subunit alcohol dehydrogenase family) n=1 Tax=Paenibacillus cellulosilyticus TaxID=375489 RepID=A0A2V2YQN8_9BACL|nr:SDR family oxidoreductase [Paenibacillus cellulosilyticus]PWV99357.1 NAD(P)-dependent dehydrogenase (short-subunit alcohol dehydrogenase family) [Paenibacillus cellulosilyticus]QKS45121.1 SDR family oxidoreductase [Paenibacillus cellulosilyticus]